MILNDAIGWSNFVALYSRVDFIPITFAQALAWFVAVGTPVFIVLRRLNRLSLLAFALVGAILGAVASPILLVWPWTLMSALAGAVSAAFCYFPLCPNQALNRTPRKRVAG